jgi:hypothetical protein
MARHLSDELFPDDEERPLDSTDSPWGSDDEADWAELRWMASLVDLGRPLPPLKTVFARS